MFYFYTPWKHQKTGGFLMFSGGIEVEHWLKMAWPNFVSFKAWSLRVGFIEDKDWKISVKNKDCGSLVFI